MKQINDFLHKNTDSPIEQLLYDELHIYGLKPVAQYDVFPFFLDLAFPEIHLAIELDGEGFHSTEIQKKRDEYRQKKLEAVGWKFERFTGSMVYKHKDFVAAKIVLKYFKNQMSEELVRRAVGRVVHYFTKRDPEFANDLIETYLKGYIIKNK